MLWQGGRFPAIIVNHRQSAITRRLLFLLALFPIWGDDAGKAGKLLFARKEVFPLSPRPSHPFKKSEKTFLFTFT
ncbi:MAG: hypothetical protein IKD29_00640, partial [Lentisphaeria bacterium]|nr:hypothetical protein [Lentisphaeria bacterium]